MKSQIGFNSEKTTPIAAELNTLLASEAVYYQNLRQFHWYVNGPKFFALHEKFEQLYNQSNAYIDELAERILTLGGHPLSKYSEFEINAKIKESDQKTNADEMVTEVLESLKILTELERSTVAQAAEIGDEGTVGLLSGSIEGREKTIWMLSAYLG